MKKLTDGMIQALRDFASNNGRNWRTELSREWCAGHDLGPELQQVRNAIGPSGLWKIKLSCQTRVSSGMRHTYNEKREWVLDYLAKHGEAGTFDDEFHDAWHKQFGGKIQVYTVGPNRCPDAVRTLRRMWTEDELNRRIVGNQYARDYCQPNWCVVYYPASSALGETHEHWQSKQYDIWIASMTL
jgi:hypothetical protein